ncbi:MAG: 2TM domain-containing protein [Hyphomicrobium sp.]|nr:2TM domain-containing protein [Hyphomicrobium sp.]
MFDTIHQRRAAKEFAAIRRFYVHVLVFVPAMLLLAICDALVGPGLWAPWIGLAWGLGLVMHGHDAFVATPRRLAEWEQHEMSRELTADPA